MKFLIIGGGAREHAIAWKLSRERDVTEILCSPGNPGIAAIARCIPSDIASADHLAALAGREGVDLTVVGPELPLSAGVVDAFTGKGLPIVGPTRAAAALESSKAFAKAFMARHHIPTARVRTCDTASDALAVLATGEFGYPVVIKADGLAAGKGVTIAGDRESAGAAIREAMVDRRFGQSGERIVIEEFLVGQEASYFVLADATQFVAFSSAQDHKRLLDEDRGPNTGGMGAFAPSPLITPEVERRVVDEIVQPVLDGMVQEGNPFRGFLYVGLMLTADGPRVVEFNVRFGDPEAQVIFPMLDEDLSWLLGSAATGALPARRARFRGDRYVGVSVAAGGYPGPTEGDRAISGVDRAAKVSGALVFHAGTALRHGQLVTAGGRVLTVVGCGPTFGHAIDVAYRAVAEISFEGMQFRRDIGRKALAEP